MCDISSSHPSSSGEAAGRQDIRGRLKINPQKLEEPQSSICCTLGSYLQRRQWHPTPVLLPGKSHGPRSLVSYSPWGREESDTTEQLHFHALEKEMETHSSVLAWRIPGTGEPGGLPSMGLQSWTRLKRLSSSSGV